MSNDNAVFLDRVDAPKDPRMGHMATVRSWGIKKPMDSESRPIAIQMLRFAVEGNPSYLAFEDSGSKIILEMDEDRWFDPDQMFKEYNKRKKNVSVLKTVIDNESNCGG